MQEITGVSEVQETKKPETENVGKIEPKSDITYEEADTYVNELFKNVGSEETQEEQAKETAQETAPETAKEEAKETAEKIIEERKSDEVIPLDTKEHYVDDETRYNQTPSAPEKYTYDGKRGESVCHVSDDTEKGRAANEKLNEKGLDGIEYVNYEPDFSKAAEASVQVDMTPDRHVNFENADKKLADMWNNEAHDGKTDWTQNDIEQWRGDNHCSWHERCDTKTMDLVDQDIHECFSHTGGRLECEVRDNGKQGGEYDDHK